MMIEKAFSRYGHHALWNKINYIVIDINSIDGLIPRLKGIGKTFPQFGRVHIFPHELRTVFFDRSGTELGTFAAGTITLKDQTPIKDYRTKFRGLAKFRRWNLADAIYFFGYAMITYSGVPFLLEDKIQKESPWKDGFRVDVKFLDGFHTHGKNQSFFFNQEGLLIRHDYHAEILGWFAHGSHFTSEFKELSGFPVACERQVYARIGSIVLPIPVLHASLTPIEVVLKN
jgi:hypothetical protein